MSAIGSLVDGFVPPKGFDGDFGWVCGFSGDADFLNVACDRFTGLSDAQRSQIGRVWLGVMLDPGCAQIPLRPVPARSTCLRAPRCPIACSTPRSPCWDSAAHRTLRTGVFA